MPTNVVVVPLHLGAEEHARAETERKRQLLAWADHVLGRLGLSERVACANSLDYLRRITFDADAVDVVLAIREALHPASGPKAAYFEGLQRGWPQTHPAQALRRYEGAARGGVARSSGRGQQSAPDWTDDLKLDKEGGVRPILSNLILFLRHHPKWQGVLGYDEFNARVVIRKRPPWGEEKPDAHWTDHHETQTRVWFQREDINAGLGDIGRAVQAAARSNPFHPVREYFEALVWDRNASAR